MLIIALTAGVVVLNMAPPTNNANSEADIFAAKLNAASEQAIMTGSMIGLELDQSGYRFFRYERGVWAETGDARLTSASFPGTIAVEFTLTEPAKKNEQVEDTPREDDAPAPTVFFAPTGETTALSAAFKFRREDVSVNLDQAGNVKAVRDGRG